MITLWLVLAAVSLHVQTWDLKIEFEENMIEVFLITSAQVKDATGNYVKI